jgi:hypothetical protein
MIALLLGQNHTTRLIVSVVVLVVPFGVPNAAGMIIIMLVVLRWVYGRLTHFVACSRGYDKLPTDRHKSTVRSSRAFLGWQECGWALNSRWERNCNAEHDPRLKSAEESPDNNSTNDTSFPTIHDWPGIVFWCNYSIVASLPALTSRTTPGRRSKIPITPIVLVVSGGELLPERLGCFGAVNSQYDYCCE